MKKLNRAIAVIVFLAFSLVGSTVHAKKGSEYDRIRLQGFNSILVAVEPLKTSIDHAALTEAQIIKDVEAKLRLKGINVLRIKEWRNEIGRPCLVINVNIAKLVRQPFYVYNVSVEFGQEAKLTKNKMICVVSTWYTANLGITSNLSTIRNAVKEEVDIFLNAWLSVNQKK